MLNGVDLAVQRGEMVAVVGASGAGKSTLMHVLGALDKPTRGYVVIGGEPVHGRDETELGELRNRTVGFVFPVPPSAARVFGARERDDAAADRGTIRERGAEPRGRSCWRGLDSARE